MNHAIKPAFDDDRRLPSETADLVPLTRAMLDEQTREVSRLALEECATEETVTLEVGGQALELRPLDTRRFVHYMSRFISMN